MANSLMQIVSDGSLAAIPLTIKFFEQSHIKVFVNNVELPDGTYTFAWTGATTVTITPAVAMGAEVSIRRTTPADEMLHNFQAGAVFSEASVDENFQQELFLLQEASEQSLFTDLFADLDMHGNGVRNVRTATLPGDAVNMAQAIAIAEGGGTSTLRAELAAAGGVSRVNGAIYNFANVASMVASSILTPRNGDVCTTAGYYTSADGGGTAYTYSQSSVAAVDGFLVQPCNAGGRWLLVDNRQRLPVQVAGAHVDGVTDDREALLAVLASNRHVLVDGVMRVSGDAVDLAPYVVSQQLSFGIEGVDPIGSQLLFDSGAGGLFSSVFFRGSSVKNINIRNATLDKTGIGFINAPGAEMLDWVNVTFTGWRCGCNIHAWNSTLTNIAARACYYAGAIYGTSQNASSHYAIQCDYAWAYGRVYSGGLSGTMILPAGGLALSYSLISSVAADECGPYLLGRCYNLKIAGIGAERGIGPYLFDMALYPPATGRQNISIECLDVYVQTDDAGVVAVFGPIANAYGSIKVENTNVFSDRNIPLFSGDGRGIKTRNVQYNTSAARKFTATVPNGLVVADELVIGSDYAQLQKVGYSQGGFDQIRKVRAMFEMPLSATGKVVLRVQDTSISGLAQGVLVSGKATFYPVRKGGNNASFECGMAIFSVAADSAGSLASINLQKLGALSTLTAASRLTGTVQELVLNLPAGAAVQYLCELEFWCNGKFATEQIDYYVAS